MYGFVADLEEIGDIPSVTEADVINEPMLFSAGWDFAHKNGGPITHSVMQTILQKSPEALFPEKDRHIVIDTRVHMLKPGFIPAIPGWHCDAWPRGKNGQPDGNDREGKRGVQHWVALAAEGTRWDGIENLAPTEFLLPTIYVNVDEERVWKSVSTAVGDQFSYTDTTVKDAENLVVYKFGVNQLHRATPAFGNGWRFFFRLSHYQKPPNGQIRKQVQVYTTEHGGW